MYLLPVTRCSDLSGLENTELSTTQQVVDTKLEVKCVDETRMWDGFTGKNVTCQLNGYWSDQVSNCTGNAIFPTARLNTVGLTALRSSLAIKKMM